MRTVFLACLMASPLVLLRTYLVFGAGTSGFLTVQGATAQAPPALADGGTGPTPPPTSAFVELKSSHSYTGTIFGFSLKFQ